MADYRSNSEAASLKKIIANFRSRFKQALADVAKYWTSPDGTKHLLNYELHEDGFTLFRSPLLISVPRRKAMQSEAEQEAARILTAKKFDDITLKQGQQIAGTEWDVKYLQKQYFDWIERKRTDAQRHPAPTSTPLSNATASATKSRA